MSIPGLDADRNASRDDWLFFVVLGGIMIALGIFAIAAPFITGVALSLVLGVALIIGALVHAASVFRMRSTGNVVTNLLLAVIYLLAGVALVTYPLGGLMALTLFLAAFFLVEGVVNIVGALEIRRYAHWGWVLFSGIVSIVLALIIWSGWPASALWVTGVLLGVDLVTTGMSMLALGLVVHATYGGVGRPLAGRL